MSTSSGSPAVLDSETNGPPRASPGRPLVVARLQPLVPLAFAFAVCSLAVLLISRLSHELDYRATVRVLRSAQVRDDPMAWTSVFVGQREGGVRGRLRRRHVRVVSQ
jgi:hypothetical protein